MKPLKFLVTLALLGFLSACGDSGPGSSDFEAALLAKIKDDTETMEFLIGSMNVTPFDPSNFEIVSVDNIRSDDKATYVADVTFHNKISDERKTVSMSLRHIDGAWKSVK